MGACAGARGGGPGDPGATGGHGGASGVSGLVKLTWWRQSSAPGAASVRKAPVRRGCGSSGAGPVIPVRDQVMTFREFSSAHPLTFPASGVSVPDMAPARVRGCAGSRCSAGAPPFRQADARRRRSGPRKATSRRPITVRLRGKSCPAGGSDILRNGRRGVVARALRDPQQADVGTKTRSAGRVRPTERRPSRARTIAARRRPSDVGPPSCGGTFPSRAARPGAVEHRNREKGGPTWTSS